MSGSGGAMRVLPRPVTFVTGNAKKLEDVRDILGQSIPFQSLKLDLPELQGEPEEISKEKARLATVQVNGPVLVDDTCLCFNALSGLLGLNNLLKAYEDKSAYAMCIFSLALGPEEEPITFVSKTLEKIVPARGPNEFGWDPVFQPEDRNEILMNWAGVVLGWVTSWEAVLLISVGLHFQPTSTCLGIKALKKKKKNNNKDVSKR